MAAYDLAALWEAHCRYEFETRDVDATMSTMVAEPYVNHIPTMTGGVGFESLRHFYAHHFIGVNPLLSLSRRGGADRKSAMTALVPLTAPTGGPVLQHRLVALHGRTLARHDERGVASDGSGVSRLPRSPLQDTNFPASRSISTNSNRSLRRPFWIPDSRRFSRSIASNVCVDSCSADDSSAKPRRA
jgi:hypothetical protein